MTEYRTAPGGTPKVTYDATANDSDKTFTVPAGKTWEVISIRVQLTCTATVGTRLLTILITDGTNVIARTARIQLTASQIGNQVWSCLMGNYSASVPTRTLDDSAANNAQNSDSCPIQFLNAGYTIRALDSAAIDAAADDMIVIIHYIEYDA